MHGKGSFTYPNGNRYLHYFAMRTIRENSNDKMKNKK